MDYKITSISGEVAQKCPYCGNDMVFNAWEVEGRPFVSIHCKACYASAPAPQDKREFAGLADALQQHLEYVESLGKVVKSNEDSTAETNAVG